MHIFTRTINRRNISHLSVGVGPAFIKVIYPPETLSEVLRCRPGLATCLPGHEFGGKGHTSCRDYYCVVCGGTQRPRHRNTCWMLQINSEFI